MSILDRIKIENGQIWKPQTNAPNRTVVEIKSDHTIPSVLIEIGNNKSKNITTLRQFKEWVHRSNAYLISEDDVPKIKFASGQQWVPASNGWARTIISASDDEITYFYHCMGAKYTRTCSRDSFLKWRFNSGAKLING